jgi:hypothetical protein
METIKGILMFIVWFASVLLVFGLGMVIVGLPFIWMYVYHSWMLWIVLAIFLWLSFKYRNVKIKGRLQRKHRQYDRG